MSDVMVDVREPREMTRAVRALENAVEELRDQLDPRGSAPTPRRESWRN
jgi:hypothetical protein